MAYVPPPDWFDLARYAGASSLDFQGWATQLGNRFHLSTMLDLDSLQVFDSLFSDIMSAPFFDLGFAASYGVVRAVYPLTFGAASCLVRSIEQTEPNKYESCDEIFDRVNNMEMGPHLHITVDLNASPAQINADFTALIEQKLEQFRKASGRIRLATLTKKVTDSWATHQILPYIDLYLWHRRQGMAMPSNTTIADWIFRDSDGDKNKAAVAGEKANDAMQLATLRRLTMASTTMAE